MAIRKSSSSGIPFGNTAGRPANPGIGQLYSNGQVGRLELYTETGWQNIVQETPGIASITGVYNESAGSGTFVLSGTNFVTGGIAYAVGTNGVEYQATTSTTNSIVQMTVTFTGLSAAYEPYDVKVLNPSNLFGLLPDAFFINDSPVWSTSSGSLGSFAGATSIQLATTDDESNAITYSITSGALPAGLSLSSAGLISGTVTASPATYTFIVSASDGSNTAVARSFSINVPFPSVSGGTLSSDSTYYYRTFTGTGNFIVSANTLNADVAIVAGGGAGGGAGNGGSDGAGGGGAGGFVLATGSSLSPNTYLASVGGGGSSVGQSTQGTPGTNSTFGTTFTNAIGGGGGGSEGGVREGGAGGSAGGGGGYSGAGGTKNQPAGNSTSGIGYGNNGGGSGNPGDGGGGGAGGVGGDDSSGAGGIGTSLISSWGLATSTGQNSSGTVYYAGGGGASGDNRVRVAGGVGGLGGGATGAAASSNSSPASGTTNTGGGGGGVAGFSSVGSIKNSGSGGSGIIIVRYTKASVGG